MKNPLLNKVFERGDFLKEIVTKLKAGARIGYYLKWNGQVSMSETTQEKYLKDNEKRDYEDPIAPNHSPQLDKDLVTLQLHGAMTLDELKSLLKKTCEEKQKEKGIEGLEFTNVQIDHELLFYQHVDNGVYDHRTARGWNDGDLKSKDIIADIRGLDFDKWTAVQLQTVPNDGSWNTNRCINKNMSDKAIDETIRDLMYSDHKTDWDNKSNGDSALRIVGIYTERKCTDDNPDRPEPSGGQSTNAE